MKGKTILTDLICLKVYPILFCIFRPKKMFCFWFHNQFAIGSVGRQLFSLSYFSQSNYGRWIVKYFDFSYRTFGRFWIPMIKRHCVKQLLFYFRLRCGCMLRHKPLMFLIWLVMGAAILEINKWMMKSGNIRKFVQTNYAMTIYKNWDCPGQSQIIFSFVCKKKLVDALFWQSVGNRKHNIFLDLSIMS